MSFFHFLQIDLKRSKVWVGRYGRIDTSSMWSGSFFHILGFMLRETLIRSDLLLDILSPDKRFRLVFFARFLSTETQIQSAGEKKKKKKKSIEFTSFSSSCMYSWAT